MRATGIVLCGAVTTVFLCAFSATAFSDSEKIPSRIPRVHSQVRVDGRLDEPVWQEALALEIGYEITPGENIPAPVRTDAFLAYDAGHLYVAFHAQDPEPSKIRARVCDRDNIWADDYVAIVLDTFNDERRNYWIACNPLGVQDDNIECPDCNSDTWDGIWDSAGRMTRDGFEIEMAIPFSSLRFQRSVEDQTWGIDLLRNYPRSVTRQMSLFPHDRNNNCYLCQAEKIIGFGGATPGRNVDVIPTFLAMVPQAREGYTEGPFVTGDDAYEPGLTARWGITPNMTFGATANPDFSQVEADAAQLEINTQFALYYSEKRPFFLEGADYFRTPLNVVHTRTLADPIWGAKLTGKESGHTIGSFVVRDEMTNLVLPGSQGSRQTSLSAKSTASVFRYRKDIGSQYTLGFLATDREGDDYFNRVAGFDGDLRFTRTDRLSVQVLGSSTRYPDAVASDFDQSMSDFEDAALNVIYTHDTRNWDGSLGYYDLGASFRSDLGFVPRVDYRNYYAYTDYTWHADDPKWWTRLNIQGQFEQYEDQSGQLIDRTGALIFTYEGPWQMHALVDARRIREGYNGQLFDMNYVHIHNCMRTRRVHPWFNLIFDDHIDYANTRLGKRTHVNGGSTLNLGLHLYMELDHTYERMEIGEERLYTAHITQGELVYHFTNRTFLRAILQYRHYLKNQGLYVDPVEAETKDIFSQVLLSYKINPHTVLFLGYSDNHYGDQNLAVRQTDRTFFAKIGYALVL